MQEDGTFDVDANTSIDQLSEELNIKIPEVCFNLVWLWNSSIFFCLWTKLVFLLLEYKLQTTVVLPYLRFLKSFCLNKWSIGKLLFHQVKLLFIFFFAYLFLDSSVWTYFPLIFCLILFIEGFLFYSWLMLLMESWKLLVNYWNASFILAYKGWPGMRGSLHCRVGKG